MIASRSFQLAVLFLALFIASPASADTAFTRIAKSSDGVARALQLAIVSYASAKEEGTTVDLISAVHIGDAAYYQDLNERFRGYDALLYELVAPEGTVIEPGAKPKGALSSGQAAMGRALELDFQLSEIDYSPKNFVHADLSPKEMAASMREREESAYSMFWSIVYASIRQQRKDPLGLGEMNKIGQVAGTNSDNRFKLLMAFEFADLGTFEDLFGEDSNNTLIGARNQKAMDVLEREIGLGKRNIGIFYGAAHMPDFEERLAKLGFEPVEIDWVDAWLLD